MNNNEKQLLTNKLHAIATKIDRNYYVQSLFNYHQSHAVYGMQDAQEVQQVKQQLKSQGANKFRKVKNILCFNASKMQL